ncbi:hypothetical protein MLN73_25920, partial [Escherichia coli]|nr:hypothetical protein [Escherichia coli]MCO0952499.1 hypothetical protein [Escherichia coli]
GNHLRKQLCNYQNACFFFPCPHENYPLFNRARAEASFRNNHPGFRYGSAIAIPPFISGQPHSRLFFTFLPGCYAGEGGALFS